MNSKYVLLTGWLFFSLTAKADTIPTKPRVNVFFSEQRASHHQLVVPNHPPIDICDYNDLHWRNFVQLQLTDTGVLQLSLYLVSPFKRPKSLPATAQINQLKVNTYQEMWLVILDQRKALDAFFKENYTYLSTTDFQKQFPAAYQRFKQRGFHAVFENVPVNTPLR